MYVRKYYFLQIANGALGQSQVILAGTWTSKRSLIINISNGTGHVFWSPCVICGACKHLACVLGFISRAAPYTVANLPKGDNIFLLHKEDPKLMFKFSFNTSRFCILQ